MYNRNELELEAAALLELQARKRAMPIFYFEPNRKLRKFFNSRCRIRMNAGGNRSGKTEHLIAEACAFALGFRPWMLRELGRDLPTPRWQRPDNLPTEALCLNGAGVRVQVPNTILIVTGLPAKRGIAEAIHPKVISMLGPLIRKIYWGHSGIPSELILENGSRIIYASAEQKGLSFEATNHTAYFVDEPISKRVYTGIRRGAVDQYAPLTFSFTPLGRHSGWMFTELYRHADKKFIDVFNISIFDNYFLSKEAIEDFAQDPTISDVEKEARLYGRFIHLVDRIYPQFEESVHVIDPIQPDPNWYTGLAIDPHTVKPWAMAWFTVTPRGDLIWFREWPEKDFTTIRRDTRTPQDYAALIRRIEDIRPADIRLLDPNYGPRSDIVRGTPVPAARDILAQYGLHCITKLNDNIEYGETRVRAMLSYDKDRSISDTNRPKMYVTANCPNIINSLLYYTALNRGGDDDFPDETKRDPTYKDFADIVRYAAVSNLMDFSLSDSFLNTTFGEDVNEQNFVSLPNTYGYGEF